MSQWRNSKLGRCCDLGVLHVGLFREPPDGPWSLFIYLRPGVVLGVERPNKPRLARLEFNDAGTSAAAAEKYAEELVERWFTNNCDALIAGEIFSV
jgi:hypothetical protein